MRASQRALLGLLLTAFEDGDLTPGERRALVGVFRHGAMTVHEIREVFDALRREVWCAVLADRPVTSSERARVLAVVRELALPGESVPSEVTALLRTSAVSIVPGLT